MFLIHLVSVTTSGSAPNIHPCCGTQFKEEEEQCETQPLTASCHR